MLYFEDFKVGEKSITPSRTITEADIVNFAALSGDWNPLHVDKEFAHKGPFGERIAHGLLVLSVTSGLFSPELIFNKWALIAFYGIDKLRFIAPTKIGDTIQTELETINKKVKNDNSGIVDLKITTRNQHNKEVLVFIAKFLLKKNNNTPIT